LTNGTEEEATIDETVAGSKTMEKVGSIEVAVYFAKRDGYMDEDSSNDDDEGTQTACSVPKSVTGGKVVHQIGRVFDNTIPSTHSR
jgi:hypothetical protein